MTELHPPHSILRRSKQYLSLAGLTSSDGPDWTFATEKKLRYTLDLRQAPRQKQHTTALQVFDFLGFRKSAGMVAKEKLSQLDVTYCLTFILSESFNNSRNSHKQRPEVQPFRDHPFKTSTNFHDFWPLPYHRHSSKMLLKILMCTVTFWPSAYGDTLHSLRHADVLNGWSHKLFLYIKFIAVPEPEFKYF